MSQFFSTELTREGVLIVRLDRQDHEMNVLSTSLLDECERLVRELERTGIRGAVITSGKKDHFIAGADIEEISKFRTAAEAAQGARLLQGLFSAIAQAKVPTVAAIHGACLGGGLEMALACTWRVASDSDNTKLGLPEVQLGLLPGAGGTQRLPRLIGIQSALDLILTGKRLDGRRALKVGLIDACVPQHLLIDEACKLALTRRRPRKRRGLLALLLEANPMGRKFMAIKAREAVDKNANGFYPAPYKILESVFRGYGMSLQKGLDLEAQLFGELTQTRECASLVHIFHAITRLKKNPHRDAALLRFGETPVGLVGVLGAGFMGSGIATICAEQDIRVRISDPSKDSVGRCLHHVNDHFAKKVRQKRLKPFEATRKVAHVSADLSPTGFGVCDIVIEAVFEDLSLKRKLLAQLEGDAHADWIFATNTSAIPVGAIAQESKLKDRVLGMHFFSPVEKMPLLEIITTEHTADWVTARAVELGQRLGKQVIIVRDGPGFYTTRTLSFYLAEGMLLLKEGYPMDRIDQILTRAGFPVGPMTLIDEVGIDVGAHVMATMLKAFPDRMIAPPFDFSSIQKNGRLGRKANKGLYTYQDGKKGAADATFYQECGIQLLASDRIQEHDIEERLLLLFVNESVRCLEEGILADPHDGDVGAVFGLGFPPFLGGPFSYVDHIGAAKICDRLSALSTRFGKRFEPAKRLQDNARDGKVFFPKEVRSPA